jgi:hypothetical protein
MITDDELDELSDDDETAFVQYEAIVRKSFEENVHQNNWNAERAYVTHILAFVDTRSIDLDLPRNPPGQDGDFSYWFDAFLRAVDYYKTSLRLRLAARKKQHVTVLTLSLDFKTQIGGHLTAMRKIVAEAQHLSGSKRDALIRRINNLQLEVDRDRTRTEAATALWLELTSAISKGAQNLDPAIDRLERIIKVLSLAKDENETKSITAPPERKRLSPPKSPESRKDDKSDEEIPF